MKSIAAILGLIAGIAATAAGAQQMQTPDVRTTIEDDPASVKYPWAVAVDSAGTVLVAESGYNKAWRYQPSAGGYANVGNAAGGTAIPDPHAVAFASDGTIFVGTEDAVIRFSPQPGGGYAATATIGSGVLNGPYGLAVDSAGNVVVADTGNSMVRRFVLDNSVYTEAAPIASGRFYYDVAVDAEGVIYVADTFAGDVLLYSPVAGAYPAVPQITLDIESGFAYGIDVDRYGNVYVADGELGRVVRFVADGMGGYSAVEPVANGFVLGLNDVAVDRMQNVYLTLSDAYSGKVAKIGDRVFGDGFQ